VFLLHSCGPTFELPQKHDGRKVEVQQCGVKDADAGECGDIERDII